MTTVSGIMLSRDGEPLPGVNIVIKGTSRGTITDLDGYYSLEAPVGATLVVSFVGYKTYEVKVAEVGTIRRDGQTEGTKVAPPFKSLPVPGQLKGGQGVAVLSDSSGSYEVKGRNSLYREQMTGPLANIRQKEINGKPGFVLVPASLAQRRRPKLRLEYSTALNRSVANKLPELQRSYAQGRSAGGALQSIEQELFSWGPALENMPSAKAYDPYQVLRAGIAVDNHLQVFSEISDVKLRAGYGNKSARGIIPGTSYNRHSIDFSGSVDYYPLEPRLFVSYSQAEEQLPQTGSNLATILGSIYTTPPNFNLLQGASGKNSWRNSSSYLDAGGEELSFAPGFVNHPYWLINHFPDRRREEKVLSGLELKSSELYPLRLHYILGFDQQQINSRFGLPLSGSAYTLGTLTERRQGTRGLNSSFSASLEPELYSSVWDLDFSAAWLFNFKKETLFRHDETGLKEGAPDTPDYPEAFRTLRLHALRKQHEIITKAGINFSGNHYHHILKLGLVNRMYFSNTLATKPVYFLPAATLTADLGWLDFIDYSGVLSGAKFFAAYAATLQEAPLLYNQWHFNSLTYNPSAYRRFWQEAELVPNSRLLPEKQQKWEFGAELAFFENKLDLKINYYRNTTGNFVLPVEQFRGLELTNIAEVITPGLELALGAGGYFSEGNWRAGLSFSRSRPRVKSIYLPYERIPVAGFRTISTNLIEGEPVGVLVGSRFMRNEAGQLVIGDAGFPLVDPDYDIIGDPNPDWLAGLNASVNYKKIGFSFLLDGRKGGDVWNGTQQFLNYYGTSMETAKLREVKNYVFEGVTPEGGVNQTKTDFYNPALPTERNRWQRYGEAGVGEEGIEEASLIRINEIRLSYNLSEQLNKLINSSRIDKFNVSLLARNLLLYTTYTGLDPAGNLFGYQHARGLDLFNQPNTESFGFAITLTF